MLGFVRQYNLWLLIPQKKLLIYKHGAIAKSIEFVRKAAALGLPAIMLLIVMATTGLAGAAVFPVN